MKAYREGEKELGPVSKRIRKSETTPRTIDPAISSNHASQSYSILSRSRLGDKNGETVKDRQVAYGLFWGGFTKKRDLP